MMLGIRALAGMALVTVAACGGQVNGSNDHTSPEEGGVSDSGAPQDTGTPPDTGAVEACVRQGCEDGTVVDEASFDSALPNDGWGGTGATEASGPPPTCASPALACGALFPGAAPFASAQDAANALVGRWSFCGSDSSGFYPPGQLGEEYTADGKYYQLIADSSGQLQRNLNPTAIGDWEVKLMPNQAIEVHTFGGNVQRGGGLSACPPSLTLLAVEARLP